MPPNQATFYLLYLRCAAFSLLFRGTHSSFSPTSHPRGDLPNAFSLSRTPLAIYVLRSLKAPFVLFSNLPRPGPDDPRSPLLSLISLQGRQASHAPSLFRLLHPYSVPCIDVQMLISPSPSLTSTPVPRRAPRPLFGSLLSRFFPAVFPFPSFANCFPPFFPTFSRSRAQIQGPLLCPFIPDPRILSWGLPLSKVDIPSLFFPAPSVAPTVSFPYSCEFRCLGPPPVHAAATFPHYPISFCPSEVIYQTMVFPQSAVRQSRFHAIWFSLLSKVKFFLTASHAWDGLF